MKLTVSETDGNEEHEVVWGDDEQLKQVEELIAKTLESPVLRNNPRLQKFYAAKLSQRLLKRDVEESQNELAQMKKRSKRSAV